MLEGTVGHKNYVQPGLGGVLIDDCEFRVKTVDG